MASRRASLGRSSSTDKHLFTAREAASFLDVKPSTVYTYVSRGWLASVPGGDGRSRLYARGDLLRLKQRRHARAGHTAVAAAALAWGDPILDSAITSLEPEGPHYRGRPAVDLAQAGVLFERVADLLWTGKLPDQPALWSRAGSSAEQRSFARAAETVFRQLGSVAPPRRSGLGVVRLGLALLEGVRGPMPFDRDADAALVEARRVLPLLAAMPAARARAAVRQRALAAEGIAGRLALAWERPPGRGRLEERVRCINEALVLCADHELDTHTFAVRVAASEGGELYACLSAGLAAAALLDHKVFSPIHALATSVTGPAHAPRVIQEILERRDAVPGFGQPPYPEGDPRATPLLRAARALAPRDRRVLALASVADAMAEAGRGGPVLEVGLVALSCALELPSVSSAVIFALGRAAGWIAHAMEQSAGGQGIRPRARYVGPGGHDVA